MSGIEPPEPVQWKEAQRWLAKAAQELAAARSLLEGRLADPAAGHGQQGLEQAGKPLTVAADQDIRRTHDLETLAAEASRFWPSLVSSPYSLASVSEWYLVSRYPDFGEITLGLGEIAEALGQIELLIEQIKSPVPLAPEQKSNELP